MTAAACKGCAPERRESGRLAGCYRVLMRIVDLGSEHEQLFFRCLEDWNPETEGAATHRAAWYAVFKDRGLRVKLALDDAGRPGGMIQYLPIEHAPVLGRDLHYVLCVWVHGHRAGRGNFQGHGMGSALLRAAEDDARALGAKGMAAWGLVLPLWMRAGWFKKHGYRSAERRGLAGLVWKPFSVGAEPPRFLPKLRQRPELAKDQVVVTACVNGWCMGQAMAFERAKSAAADFPGRVRLRVIDTKDRTALLEWGETDALFVEDKRVVTGPPPSREKLVGMISRAVRRHERAGVASGDA